jgi:hypothetical protein
MRQSAPVHHFRTYFIAWAANAYSAMDYYVSSDAPSPLLQPLKSPLENPPRRALPAAVEK